MDNRISQDGQPIEFSFLAGCVDLEKSVKEAKETGRRMVWGEITNPNKDEEGERLLSKSLDWSYFDDQGWVKYEHVHGDPNHFVGKPLKRELAKGGGTLILAGLMKGKGMSDDVWKLIERVTQLNKDFPENPRTLGWSIEGNYSDGKEAKGGLRKAKVINVVITPTPVNKSVYLKQVEDNYKELAKSLSATPVSTDVSAKVGGDAIVKEELDDKVKVTTTEEDVDGKKKKKTVKKSTEITVKFKNYDEAVKNLTEVQDVPLEEAEKFAKSMFPDKEEPLTEGKLRTMLKSLIPSGSVVEPVVADVDADPIAGDPLPEEGELVDATPVLEGLQKSLDEMTTLLSENIAYGYQRDAEFAKSLDRVEALETEMGELKKSMTFGEGDKAMSINKAMPLMLNNLVKSMGSNVDLNSLELLEEGTTDGTPPADVEPAKVSYVKLQETLSKGVSADKITHREQASAEAAYRTNPKAKLVTDTLAKAMAE